MTQKRSPAPALSDDATVTDETIGNNPRDGHKRSVVMRLRRVEGQLRGVQNMIEQDAECEAVAQQIAARYANRPNAVAFELLNEPKDNATT